MTAIKLANDTRDVFNYLRGTLNFVTLPAAQLIDVILLIVDGNGPFVDYTMAAQDGSENALNIFLSAP